MKAPPISLMIVYIATPTAEKIHSKTVGMLISLSALLTQNGHGSIFDTSMNNTIHFARNIMTQKAMDANADVLLFLDSDVYAKPSDLYKILTSDREITALSYRKKKASEQYCCLIESDEKGFPKVDDGWVELSSAGTGILAIKRSAIEKMIAKYAHRKYRTDFGDEITALFEYEIFDGRYWGEDYTFCRRWRDIGGKIWLWPDADTKHIGNNDHTGNIHYFLMKDHESSVPEYEGNTISGWMADVELEWLYQKAKNMMSVAEIGSWKGRSTHALCTGCVGPIYAIDHFNGTPEDGHDIFIHDDNIYKEFIENVGGFSNLRTHRMDSLSASEKVPSVDMVFIDGAHDYESVKSDMETWWPKTKRLFCGHDYNDGYPGVKKAVDELLGPRVKVYGSIWYYNKDEYGTN